MKKGFLAQHDLSRYSWAVRPPPQDAERNEEDRWGSTVRKSPIGKG